MVFLIIALLPGTSVFARDSVNEPTGLYSGAAVLMDGASGRVLFQKDGEKAMAMASTTKIMTCILVLEEGNLDDRASVSAYAASMPKVKMYASKGETYEVRNLLFSMMLESHNDSAVVLAEYIGREYLEEELRQKDVSEYTPDQSKAAVRAFAKLMNQKAMELGCKDTWFITPNGLDATETLTAPSGETIQMEHKTSARDLARIMAYCVNQSPCRDVFREITRTESYTFCDNARTVTCRNHNTFLQMMEGAFSGKTGFTNKAGYCYVGALERDGRSFIIALLACGWPNHRNYKWQDAGKLFGYGLEYYFYHSFDEDLLSVSQLPAVRIPVDNGQTRFLGQKAYAQVEILREAQPKLPGILLRSDEEIQVTCQLEKKLSAPVYQGEEVGQIQYCLDGKTYLTEKVVLKGSVAKIDLNWCILQVFRRFLFCTV